MDTRLFQRIQEAHRKDEVLRPLYRQMYDLLKGYSFWLVDPKDSPLIGEAQQKYERLHQEAEQVKKEIHSVVTDVFMQVKDTVAWTRGTYDPESYLNRYERDYRAELGGGYKLRMVWSNLKQENSIDVRIHGLRSVPAEKRETRDVFGLALWTRRVLFIERIPFPDHGPVIAGPLEEGDSSEEIQKEEWRTAPRVRAAILAKFISLREKLG